jgi:Na+/glutamate symporter
LPHPYEPSNLLRLSSGALAGTALAVGLGHIFASSLWANRQPQEAVVERVGDLAPPLAIAAALGGLALTGLPVLYAPFAVGLLVAAIAVFWTLAIVVLSLTCGRGWSYEGYAELASLSVAALIVAVVAIGALSGLRVLAEQALGLPRLT